MCPPLTELCIYHCMFLLITMALWAFVSSTIIENTHNLCISTHYTVKTHTLERPDLNALAEGLARTNRHRHHLWYICLGGTSALDNPSACRLSKNISSNPKRHLHDSMSCAQGHQCNDGRSTTMHMQIPRQSSNTTTKTAIHNHVNVDGCQGLKAEKTI